MTILRIKIASEAGFHKGAENPHDAMMRTLMLVVLLVMIGSILSILIIKPFSHNANDKNPEPPKTIQQSDPQK